MYPIGHVSLATLLAQHRATAEGRPVATHADLIPVLFGALLPDLVDKSILYLGASPYGRTVGHSLLVLALFSAIWGFLRIQNTGGTRAFGWMLVGWASHLGGDLIDDFIDGAHFSGYLFSGWMGWPYSNPDMWEWKSQPIFSSCDACLTIFEVTIIAGAIWSLWSSFRSHRHTRPD